MKQATFTSGIAFTLASTLSTGLALIVLAPMFGFWLIAMLAIPTLTLSYLWYLRSRSTKRVGWIFSILILIAISVGLYTTGASMMTCVLVNGAFIWLVRSLNFHSSIFASLVDLGLIILSIAAAFWAIGQTGSISIGVWCFFLVQAFHVAIPRTLGHGKSPRQNHHAGEFEQANRRAEAAINQLLTH